MKTNYITNWNEWVELCEHFDHDPRTTIEFGIDRGGGNSTDFEYIGDIPTDRGK